MTPRPAKSDPVWELIDAVCYSDADAEQLRQLDRRLSEDPQACDLYNDYCQLHAELIFRAKNQESFEAFRTTFRDSQPSSYRGFLSSVYQGTVSYFSQEVPFALLIGAAIVGLGLLAGSLISVTHYVQVANTTKTTPANPNPADAANHVYVARITGMADCRCEKRSRFKVQGSRNENSPFLIPSPVSLGDKFVLASGLMEITYDTGAKVLLQAPVTYEVDTCDGGFLSVGKLTAKLEKKPAAVSDQQSEKVAGQPLVAGGQWSVASEANPKSQIAKSQISNPLPFPAPRPQSPAPIFAVRTPTAVVTDLGTEFGVEVSKNGATTSHVFQGVVRFQAMSDIRTAIGEAQVLHEDQSARVASDNSRRAVVLPSGQKANAFVRTMPLQEQKPDAVTKAFDLVDVVAGGDGFSGRRGWGIDPITGQVSDKQPQWQPPPNEYLIGDNKYHRVEKRPFIDGIFIPNGEEGPVQVDSAGHTFSSFPITKNETAGFLWAGGTIPNSSPFAATRTDLGGIDYASKGHGLLLVHANKGITFDLRAIRQANPGWHLTRFCATAGITSDASVADFWVLVDGHIRFRRWQTNSTYGAIPISVAISENERFLTLAATDGGNGISADWTIFGDPHLQLTKEEKMIKPEKQHP